MQILLLEDDFKLGNEIRSFFESSNCTCDVVYDGLLLLKQFKLNTYDVVILDINVPGLNGLGVCENIRLSDKITPILMLTAFGELDDKLNAFSFGADDYLVKPFHFEELLARVNSLNRRKIAPQLNEEKLIVADLEIQIDAMRVYRKNTEVKLTPKEFKLLLILAKAKGRVLSKQSIADELWDYQIETNQNTIEVYINFLRRKIDKDHDVKLLHTRVGFGYYLKEGE
jgi:DNA-binding response OmpR family regulator